MSGRRLFLSEQHFCRSKLLCVLRSQVHLFVLIGLDDPQDAVVANMYKTNRAEFNKTAKEWTVKFASPSFQQDKIKILVEMGFDEKVSKVI